jgi:hypothetical protein
VRKSIPIKLSDGNSYEFSERNREDSDYFFIQEQLRKEYYRQLQDSIDDKEVLLSLLMMNQKREFSNHELALYSLSNKELRIKTCFDSFKVANPGIDLASFYLLINDQLILDIIKLILELEEVNSSELEDELNEYLLNSKLSLADFIKILAESNIDMKKFTQLVYPVIKKKELQKKNKQIKK